MFESINYSNINPGVIQFAQPERAYYQNPYFFLDLNKSTQLQNMNMKEVKWEKLDLTFVILVSNIEFK